jgi:hypothetical protein
MTSETTWPGRSSATTSAARSAASPRPGTPWPGTPAASHAAAAPNGALYNHALSDGVTTALTIGAAATVLALIVTLLAIRVRREDLPDSPMVM